MEALWTPTSQELFGALLVGIQIGLLVPLIINSYRKRTIEGISPVGESIWVSAGIGWLVYGLWSPAIPLIFSGAAASIGSFAILALTWRTVPVTGKKKSILYAVLVAAGLAAPSWVWGLAGLSYSLAVFGVVQFIPQIAESARRIIKKEYSPGVAVIPSTLRGLYTLGWAGYAFLWSMMGVANADPPLIAWGVAGAVAFFLQAVTATIKNPLQHAAPQDSQPVPASHQKEESL